MDYSRILSAIFFVAVLLTAIPPASAATGIDDMEVSVPNSIDTGGNFDVFVKFTAADDENNADVDVGITVDGVLVHQKVRSIDLVDGRSYNFTINSNDFELEEDDLGRVWSENLMNYRCGDNLDVEVTLSGDIEDTVESDKIDINGDDGELSVSLDPELPAIDEKFIVAVIDEDDDELNGASVKLTWTDYNSGIDDATWDVDDKSKIKTTDSDGEADFKISNDMGKSAYGNYQIDVTKADYCKETLTMSVLNGLNMSGPTPANPKAGEQFRVNVTSLSGKAAIGLIVTLTPGNVKSQVLQDGTAPFTIASPGSYTLIVGGGTTGYDEVMKTVQVSTKSQLTIDFSSAMPPVGKEMTLTVTANDAPVEGATVKVTPQGGTEQTVGTTSKDGTVKYTPATSVSYTVKASKTTYDEATDTFTSKGTFQIELPPASDLKKGSQVTVTVKDASGNPVPAATVYAGPGITGPTDTSGKYTFTLPDVGTYTISVTKAGYSDGTATLSTTGQLSVKVDKKEIALGDSVKITVMNSNGQPVESSLDITGPSVGDTKTASEYSYTPTKAGDYQVRASKASYGSSSDTFKVLSKTVTVTYMFQEDKLYVNVTSGGRPQQGVPLTVTLGNASLKASTDSTGMASVPANETGEYVIAVAGPDYTGAPVTALKSTTAIISDLWVPVLIVLVVLVLIGIFAVVAISLMQRRGGGSKPTFKRRSDGTHLGR
ncbi:MAG: carboxypeptidase regulatory-like domain-containing protein [Candidatus Altiarchaeota archaeon]